MVYCIGLTGNIASGKSTVAASFAKLGIAVISADQIAKDLTASNQPAFQAIVKHVGVSVLNANGELNRRHLRQLIFKDPGERLWLEKLLHPLIREQINREIAKVHTPFCIIEIPLLSNKANYPYLNRVLVIHADPELRVARVVARDGGTRDDALSILATQKSPIAADDTLINQGTLDELHAQVVALHEKYLQLSS